MTQPTLSTDATAEAVSSDDALRALTGAVRQLSLAERIEDVQRVVSAAARKLTGSDGATLALRDGDQCLYVDEDAIEPLWKGDRLPLAGCISGWAMLNHRDVVIEDVYADRRIPHDAYRDTFVKSLLIAPIRTMDPLGAIGVYWAKPHSATEREVGLARALADSTAVALEHVHADDGLKPTIALSETDVLTGLPNRRAWDRAFADALHPDALPLCIARIALDRLEDYNDLHGHPTGDELLQRVAEAWRATLREGDMLARYGGEEFAILLPGCEPAAGRRVAERLSITVPDEETASIGLASWDGDEAGESLLGRADAALHEAKAAGHAVVVAA